MRRLQSYWLGKTDGTVSKMKVKIWKLNLQVADPCQHVALQIQQACRPAETLVNAHMLTSQEWQHLFSLSLGLQLRYISSQCGLHDRQPL